MAELPLILVTNDDGIESPGLLAAAEAVSALGRPLIVAPETEQTGMSRAYPRGPAIGSIAEVPVTVAGERMAAYAVNGSPAIAVSHAMLELADSPVSLCVSGINRGANIGLTINVSGTVGAAFDADAHGIPAVAVSREFAAHEQRSAEFRADEWQTEMHFVRQFAEAVLTHGLPDSTAVLNLNIPVDAEPGTPVRRTRQAQQNYFELERPDRVDRSSPWRLATRVDYHEPHLTDEDDIKAVIVDRVVSYTMLCRTQTDEASWPAFAGSPARL